MSKSEFIVIDAMSDRAREWMRAYKENTPHGPDSGGVMNKTDFRYRRDEDFIVIDAMSDRAQEWIRGFKEDTPLHEGPSLICTHKCGEMLLCELGQLDMTIVRGASA